MGGTHDVRPAEYDHLFTGSLNAVALEHDHDAVGGSGQVGIEAKGHAPHIDRGEAVYVLAGVDGQIDGVFVEVPGQGQLHDVAIDVGVIVELTDDVQ